MTLLVLDGKLCLYLCALLQVELGEQLQRAGKLGDFGRMQSALQQLVAPAVKLPQPTEKVLLAFIYAVAMAELSRAALAPLPDAGTHKRERMKR